MLVLRGGPVVLNRWTHLVGTFDGALRASGAVGAFTANASQPLTVGQGPVGNGWFFPGRVDEAALYGAALSTARVRAHHAVGTSAYEAAVLAHGPLGYWRL